MKVMKRIQTYIIAFVLLLCAAQLRAQNYRIGDIVTDDYGIKGVVFYINPTRTEAWIVALEDLSASCPWGSNSQNIIALTDFNYGTNNSQQLLTDIDGFSNTQKIRAVQTGNYYAARRVRFDQGWYLPAAGQLQQLFSSLVVIDTVFANAGGTTLSEAVYWSSSERTSGEAWGVVFGGTGNGVVYGRTFYDPKTTQHHVR